jgi:hypothetical protein
MSAEYIGGYLKDEAQLEGISIDMIVKVATHVERMGREIVHSRGKSKPGKEKGDAASATEGQ